MKQVLAFLIIMSTLQSWGQSITQTRLTPALSKTSRIYVALPTRGTSFSMKRGAVAPKREISSSTSATTPNSNGRFCTERVISAEKGDGEAVVLGNQNDKVYPGAIYYDNAFISGTYNAPTDLRLKPYEITTDLYSAAFRGSSIIQVQPAMGSVYDGISTLMRQSGNVKNASKTFIDVQYLSSSEQLAFEVGAGYTGYGVDLNADFNYMKNTNKTVFIAKLTQVYFSVMLNRAMGSLLAEAHPNAANLVYVNKVNYGRMGYLMIASDSSKEKIEAALNFAYNSASSGEVRLNASAQYERTLSNMQVKGFFFGGDATNTMPINSPNQLRDFNAYVSGGLRLDPNVAPVAVSYELKYLNDNATAVTRATTTYTERECTPAKGIQIQFHNVAIEDVHGGDCSYAWGSVRVEVWETNAQKVPIKPIWASSSPLWSASATSPNRTVINHADIRADKPIRQEIRDIPNGTRNIMINPLIASENRVMIRFKIDIKTNHKDNDFAAVGFHGMSRPETIDKMLSEVFVSRQTIQSRPANYKYGTFSAGRFCSNTDRVHCFYGLFTVTDAQQ
ncbi:MAG: thiol-activated cytolysin family protein [Bacteroidota bacterium]